MGVGRCRIEGIAPGGSHHVYCAAVSTKKRAGLRLSDGGVMPHGWIRPNSRNSRPESSELCRGRTIGRRCRYPLLAKRRFVLAWSGPSTRLVPTQHADARIPAKNCFVVARRTHRLGSLVPRHRFVKPFDGDISGAEGGTVKVGLRATL